jgi:hypothetical protein
LFGFWRGLFTDPTLKISLDGGKLFVESCLALTKGQAFLSVAFFSP